MFPYLRLLLLLLLFAIAVPLHAETLSGKVSWIYDGDTLKVNGVGKVRLLGIDTPERKGSPRDNYYIQREHIAPERLREIAHQALQFNIKQVKGRRVRLEFDRERRDNYGRVLAYLYLPDGTLLNRQLIKHGLAAVYRRFTFREKENFLRAEKSARAARLGLWRDIRRKD